MVSKNIYKEVLEEYEILSINAKKRFNERRELCYKKCPRIKEIEDELNMTSVKIAKAVIKANKLEKEKYLEEIKNINEKLKAEKRKLMRENGFTDSFFEDIYICKKCKDTGFIDNKECNCFKQKLINKAYDMSNIAEIIKVENFDSFSLDYYSKEKKEGEEMSPFENMGLILKKCTNFIEEFDEKFTNLVFYGNTGLGKTFLCRSIAKDLLDKGKIVLYITSGNLFEMFEKQQFDKDNKDVDENILNLTKEADLLIIDDLGTEFITSFSNTELFEIINSRILSRKPTLISTNLSPEELTANYSRRIVSRLYGDYQMVKFYGNDIRVLKKLKDKV